MGAGLGFSTTIGGGGEGGGGTAIGAGLGFSTTLIGGGGGLASSFFVESRLSASLMESMEGMEKDGREGAEKDGREGAEKEGNEGAVNLGMADGGDKEDAGSTSYSKGKLFCMIASKCLHSWEVL